MKNKYDGVIRLYDQEGAEKDNVIFEMGFSIDPSRLNAFKRSLVLLEALATGFGSSPDTSIDTLDNEIDCHPQELVDQIALYWSTEDIQSVHKMMGKREARKLLHEIQRKHDASVGVNWDVIKYSI